MTQLTRKLPIALRLILRGFPGTDGLMSPPKDTKVNYVTLTVHKRMCTSPSALRYRDYNCKGF